MKKYLKRKYLEGKLSTTKLIALPMKETLDKQGIEEEKGIVVKDIVEEAELVKEIEEKTK